MGTGTRVRAVAIVELGTGAEMRTVATVLRATRARVRSKVIGAQHTRASSQVTATGVRVQTSAGIVARIAETGERALLLGSREVRRKASSSRRTVSKSDMRTA